MKIFRIISILITIATLTACAEDESLENGTVDVKNMSVFFSITSVYLKPSSSSDWGNNRLPNGYLGTTDTITVTGLEPCNQHWDLQAYFSDSTNRKVSKVYLSCGGVVTFNVYY